MKMKKNILLVAVLAMTSTPTIKSMDDPLKTVIRIAAGGAVVIGVATLGYLAWNAPYICPGCEGPIREEESYVYGSKCFHRFHTHHYVNGTVCQQCLRDKYVQENFSQALNNAAERDRQQAELAAAQDAEYVRQQRRDQEKKDAEKRAYDKHLQERARKTQQAWQTKRGEEEAQRVAQQESRNARGGYTTTDQAKRDQEEALGYNTAVTVALEETRALRERQAFDHAQAAIKSTGWMMEECSICLAPRAQNGDVLIDLKDPKHKKHTTALPCGHVFHTACIKEAANHDNRCPVCRTGFNPRDL